MFGHIVPCGIRDRGVTSMAALLGTAPAMRAVVDAVTASFARHFDYDDVDFQATSPARFAVSQPAPLVLASVNPPLTGLYRRQNGRGRSGRRGCG